MKRIVLFLVGLVAFVAIQAAGVDRVYLINGNVIKGQIVTEANGYVTIVATTGREYTYPVTDIRKVEYSTDTNREVVPEVNQKGSTGNINYAKNNTGFWFSVEALGGYSVNIDEGNIGFAEVDFYAGYRFNEFARIGLGLGPRYYINNDRLRWSSVGWAMPIMLNVRGNFIPSLYRTVVPYYSVDLGCTVRDGFMFRPTIGVRFGEKRSAFLLGVSYMGQNIKAFDFDSAHKRIKVNKFTSFFALRLGYEF